MWQRVKDWSGVIALVGGLLLWSVRAMGFQSTTTDDRLIQNEVRLAEVEKTARVTANDFSEFKDDQRRVNNSLLIWMCVTDRQSAVMAQVPCSQLGVDRNGAVVP